ncbi:hypothetical protein HUJ04_009121 [Dendroctonus ponderosae]|nr:hypothetical protein HUJ04_009121 [Dendroctonus ponderosae]
MSFGSINSEKIDEVDFGQEELNQDFFIKGFDYVVEIKTGEPICFGSTISRNTAPIGKGLSPFQKRNARELFPHGPASYHPENFTSALDAVLNKVRSKKGVAPLASKDKRFKEKIIRTPSPGRYEIVSKPKTVPNIAPFGFKAKYKRAENNNPGPGTYDVGRIRKCRRTRFMNNFGRPSMIHAVETVCVSVPSDVCLKCNEIIKGDYWHQDYNVFLCHLCWTEEIHAQEMYTKQELREFKAENPQLFLHAQSRGHRCGLANHSSQQAEEETAH